MHISKKNSFIIFLNIFPEKSRICSNFLIFLRTDALGHTNIYAVCLKRGTERNDQEIRKG